MTQPTSRAALLRKIARLEAQLEAAEAFVARMARCDIHTIMQNADMKRRMEQAAKLLSGDEEL